MGSDDITVDIGLWDILGDIPGVASNMSRNAVEELASCCIDEDGRPVAVCLYDLEDDRPERLWWCLAVLKERGLLLQRLPGQETYRRMSFFRYSDPEWMLACPKTEITVV